MEVDEVTLQDTETASTNDRNEFLMNSSYQHQDGDVSTVPSNFVFQVVNFPQTGPQHVDVSQHFQLVHSQPSFLNVKVEPTYDTEAFNTDGTLQIFSYQQDSLAPEYTSNNEQAKNESPTKFKHVYRPTLSLHTSSPINTELSQVRDASRSPSQESPVKLIESPVYVKIYLKTEDSSSRKRSTKIPQALPLQKVSKRKWMDHDEESLGEEEDEEVIVLMNGILTKVGKPSAPASSGKIYSTAQNCPITVKWLLENFESMVGQSLPRSFVYDQYVAHCGLNKIDSVNAASFGKLIRSVFLGLRTRRLGTRGNSKYHYYGIKIKDSSHLLPILNSIRAEQDLLNDTVNGRIRKRVRRTQSVYTGKHVKGLVIDKKIEIQENLGSLEFRYPDISICKEGVEFPEGLDDASVEIFEESYRRHCTRLVEFFHEFKLIDVLAEVANFWRLHLTFKRKGLEDYSTSLSKAQLFKITSLEVAEVFVVRMDLFTYQHIINILVPSVLRPLPLQMLQAVDNMIQDILGLATIAMNGFPKRFVHNKLRSLTAFVRIWKQYSKMSQLSEFMELTLENEGSVLAMRQSIKSVQLSHICHRAAMIVESETMTSENIFQMMKSFSDTLERNQSMELWCEWAHKEVMTVVATVKSNLIEDVELVTAEMHSCWLITSNLVVNAIRELCGSESSLFVPLLQWCGELMQYFRQRLLDAMKEAMPLARFHLALLDEDMSVNFMDKHKVMPLAEPEQEPVTIVEEEPFPPPLFLPASVRILDSDNIKNQEERSQEN